MTPSKAYAYLDPGTGSIILQAILGFIAAAITSISIYWTKFKSLLNKIFRKKKIILIKTNDRRIRIIQRSSRKNFLP